MLQKLSTLILKFIGWTLINEIPEDIKKGVILQAPHTSMLDFVIGRMAFWHYGVKINLLVKKEAFQTWYGGLLRAMGGIPVDRSKNTNLVDTVAKMFEERESLFLVVTPEGTRKRVDNWKKGFYYIALKAQAPIIIGFIDYTKKIGGIGPFIYPSGDIEKDFEIIQDYLRGFTGKNKGWYNLENFDD
jgi:1-acyl-sn-glycerol-3-phosphate acyltransferase